MMATPTVTNYGPSNFPSKAVLKTKRQIENDWVKFLDKKSNISIRQDCYWWKCPPPLLRSLESDHIFLVGLRKATFYKADKVLRQFQYEQGMPSSRGRKPFVPVDTTPTSVRNMLLDLDMADQVDQSFVKVYFYKIIVEYSNWLVGKIRYKETNMASIRKQFLEDNQGKQGDNNYEFKTRQR